MARTFREIKETLATMPPDPRGRLNDGERALLLEARAGRARSIGDEEAVDRYSTQADRALKAHENGEGNLSRNPELPHFAGDIVVHKVDSAAQQVPVEVAHTDGPHQTA